MANTFVDPDEPENPHEPLKFFSLGNEEARADVGSRAQRLILDILQTMFGSDEILDGCPNPYRWYPSTSGDESEILIAHSFVEEHTIKNPNHSILVGRRAIETMKTGINNWNQPNLVKSGGKFSTLARTAIDIECKSRKSKEANTIATLVWMALLMYRDVIRRRGDFFRVGNPVMGAEQVAKGQQDSEIKETVVLVSLPLEWSMTWVFSSNLRKKLQVMMTTNVVDC